MKFIEKIDKKYRFIAYSIFITIYAYFASIVFWNSSFYMRAGLGAVLLVVSVLFIHYPNVSPKNFAMATILPSYLLGSLLLALKYFPNLSIFFKSVLIGGSALLFYVTALIDNVFLVVEDRQETIPLYRVAVPWSQILLVIISIPLYAGIFKIPTYSLLQVITAGLFAFVLNLYQVWTLRFEDRVAKVGVGENTLLSALVAFFVVAVALGISFLSTESFLRGLATAAALMFGLFYTNSFLRNTINQKLLAEYFIILILFVFLVLVFPAI